MKSLYIILFSFLLISFSSCNKFLETSPTNSIAPENYYNTEADLNAALNGVYDILTAYDEMYGQNYQLELTAATDETYRNSSSAQTIGLNNATSTNIVVERHWATLYRAIELANNLLANINKPPMDKAKRDIIEGEALFLRSYYFFMLVNSFGNIPMPLVPTASVNNTNMPQVAAKDVYTQIIADMTRAQGLLANQKSSTLDFGGRVSQTAVQAMLARVCLYNAGHPVRDVSKYQDALNWANKVIASGEHELNPDYKQIFINYAQDRYDVKESIWECEFWGNRQQGSFREAGRIGNFSGPQANDNAIGTSYGSLKVHAKIYNLYDPVDLRRDWNSVPYTYGNVTTNAVKLPNTNIFFRDLGKFRREYETLIPKDRNYTSQNFPLIRYSDVLLMKAEAENELTTTPSTDAIKAVNDVRRRGAGVLLAPDDRFVVSSITITNPGSNYTATAANPIVVTISGGGGSGATAIALAGADKKIAVIMVTNPGPLTSAGTYYTSAPTVTISGGGGTGATAMANIAGKTSNDLTPAQTVSRNAFRAAIQDERARELVGEALRKADLVRWGIYIKAVNDNAAFILANAPVAQQFTAIAGLNASERDLLLPIPAAQLGLNKALVQNLDW